MAKRKKSRKTNRSAGQPSASLMRQIGAALEMVEEGEEESAYLKLHQLVQRNPRSKLALTTYLELCQDMDRWQPFAYYSEQLLQNEPDCVPALNNLSFTQFTIGNVEEAKRTAQKVLDRDPVNFHALGNLVRYHFLTAEFDKAHSFAERLKQISGDHSDLEKKRAEAFAFLGDDRQVWATYERANEKQEELSSLHLHLAAAASYRLGDQKTAWKLWRQAFKILPSFELAQECLADKWLPEGEREVPWYWSYPYWFSQDFGKILEKHVGTNIEHMSETRIERGMKSLLAERPEAG